METKFTKMLIASECVLLLVDYHARRVYATESHDRTYLKNNVIALAKGAEIFHIPAVLTPHNSANNGPFLHKIVEMFPKVTAIDRKIPGFDALDDKDVLDAVKKRDGNNWSFPVCGRAWQ